MSNFEQGKSSSLGLTTTESIQSHEFWCKRKKVNFVYPSGINFFAEQRTLGSPIEVVTPKTIKKLKI